MNKLPPKEIFSPFALIHSFLSSLAFNRKSNPYHLTSYSQEGEDLILHRIFEEKDCGFYVDVGAHHPQRFSNTYFFYKKGWRGINIDAMPGSMELFNQQRPRDINLELAVMESSCARTYFKFNEPALNGFSRPLSEKRNGLRDYVIVGEVEIIGMTLREILDSKVPPECEIDFLTIDVEGLDLEVLISNDWKRHRPYIILIEILASSLDEIKGSPVYVFMQMHGYHLYAKTLNTAFFMRSN